MIDIFVGLAWVLVVGVGLSEVVETVVLPVSLAVVAEVWEVTRIEVVVAADRIVTSM